MLIDSPDYLDVLDQQKARHVELVYWGDGDWYEQVRKIAERHAWTTVWADGAEDALRKATGVFVLRWSVQVADADAIDGLVQAARRDPHARGAMAANFDPAILWRREEFDGPTGRTGLASASIIAMSGRGSDVHRGSDRPQPRSIRSGRRRGRRTRPIIAARPMPRRATKRRLRERPAADGSRFGSDGRIPATTRRRGRGR